MQCSETFSPSLFIIVNVGQTQFHSHHSRSTKCKYVCQPTYLQPAPRKLSHIIFSHYNFKSHSFCDQVAFNSICTKCPHSLSALQKKKELQAFPRGYHRSSDMTSSWICNSKLKKTLESTSPPNKHSMS